MKTIVISKPYKHNNTLTSHIFINDIEKCRFHIRRIFRRRSLRCVFNQFAAVRHGQRIRHQM